MKRGFTLVETLGAVLLLSIALVGPMTVAEKGLQVALIAKDQNSAFNLAQDAVEYIRFARDTNCLVASNANLTPCPAANWLSGGGLANTVDLTPCVTVTGTNACAIDSVASTVTTCSAAVCSTPVYYDTVNNYFTSVSGVNTVPTIFTRSVLIKYNPSCSGTCNPAEASTTVTVSWNDPVAHSITVNETLYDWQ